MLIVLLEASVFMVSSSESVTEGPAVPAPECGGVPVVSAVAGLFLLALVTIFGPVVAGIYLLLKLNRRAVT